MSNAIRRPRAIADRHCDSCDDVAVGVVAFVTDGGPIEFDACHTCATDALINSRTHVRFCSNATKAEVRRGLPGSAA